MDRAADLDMPREEKRLPHVVPTQRKRTKS